MTTESIAPEMLHAWANRRRLQITAAQVLAQILTLQPPDPAAVLLGALGVSRSGVRNRLDAVMPDS